MDAEVKTFVSEDEKTLAINELPETATIEELDAIRNAEIKPQEETEDKPENPEEEEAKIEEPAEEQPAQSEEEEKEYVYKGKLPGSFKTPGEVFKSFEHSQGKIADQQEIIRKQAEEIARYKQQSQAPKEPQPKPNYQKSVVTEDELTKLSEKLANIEDEFSDEYRSTMKELINKQNSYIINAHKKANEASEYITTRQQDERTKQQQTAVEQEYKAYDNIGQQYGEYKTEKSYQQVNNDYIDWIDSAALYAIGKRLDRSRSGDLTPQGGAEFNQVAQMLESNDYHLLKSLESAGIPAEAPNKDIKNLMELNFLADIRDGYRNPETGDYFGFDQNGMPIQKTRYNPANGEMVPAVFGEGDQGLAAVIDHRRKLSGYYKKREMNAHKNGMQQTLDAIEKRDTNELENNLQDKKGDPMQVLQEMMAERDKISELDPDRIQKLKDINQKIDMQIEAMQKT